MWRHWQRKPTLREDAVQMACAAAASSASRLPLKMESRLRLGSAGDASKARALTDKLMGLIDMERSKTGDRDGSRNRPNLVSAVKTPRWRVLMRVMRRLLSFSKLAKRMIKLSLFQESSINMKSMPRERPERPSVSKEGKICLLKISRP